MTIGAPARRSSAIDDGLDAAVRVFRAAACTWLVVVTVLSYASIERPVAAAVGVVAAVVVTAAWWVLAPTSAATLPGVALRSRLVGAELVVGAGLVAADGWVYDDGRAQSFGGVWPLAGVLAVAVRRGRKAGVAAGVVLGVARALGELVVVRGEWSATRVLAVASTGVLLGLAGWAAGWSAFALRSAQARADRSEARAEVAAELHDGVLQTLAVIQRRSDDTELVHLARSQEAELRRFLAEAPAAPGGREHVEARVRAVAAEATARFDLRVEVATVPPLPALAAEAGRLLGGAVAECLANVAKHAGVDRAVLYAGVEDDDLVVSVRDDGVGFVPGARAERGLTTSIRDRVEALGGRVRIDSRPGAGTTVTMLIPLEER